MADYRGPRNQGRSGNIMGGIDYDDASSWNWPGSEQLRPQTRIYRIIGRNGKPTGRTVAANNEVGAAALRQEQRDAKGTVYLPAAELIDIIYDDDEGDGY